MRGSHRLQPEIRPQMALVPVTLKIEEVAFIPVMRILHGLPGVADVAFNLDDLRKSPKQQKTETKPASNGNGARPHGIKALLIALLLQGPQHLAVLKKHMVNAGFSETGLSSELYMMRKAGITESGGVAIHKLTDKAMRELQQERLALPAPDPEHAESDDPAAPRVSKPKLPFRDHNGSLIILRVMQADGDGGADRRSLAHAIREAGLSDKTVDNSLYRLRERGLIRSGPGRGAYLLTSKGRKFEVPPQVNQGS